MNRPWISVLVVGSLCWPVGAIAAPRQDPPRVWRVEQDGSGNFNGRDEQAILRAIAKAAPSGGTILIGSEAEGSFVDGAVRIAEQDNTSSDNVSIGSLRGRVTCDGKPLPGTLVSDGCRVVRTGAQGDYQLQPGPDSGPFLFVTIPAGYWTDAFCVPLGKAQAAGGADFALRAVPQSKRFQFVFVTDMHLESGREGIAKTRASLAEIDALRPAFLWAQGDICLQGRSGPAWRQCLAAVRMPVRNGAGNHEMMVEHRDPRDDFHRLFGPTYYSFDWAGLHCIVLDGNKVIPGIRDFKAVHGAIEGSELRWLEADLAAQPKGRLIVVGIHIPIVSTYPQRRRESPKDAPYWEVTNSAALTDLFARHGVRLVLQGHMHENERITVKGVEYAESISLSGSWFQGRAAPERGVDGSPRGYRLVTVDGDTLTHCYRSSAESRVDRQGEIVGADKPFAPNRPVDVVFNCYDAPQRSTAECQIDRGAWRPMPEFAAIKASQGLKMVHHFRAEGISFTPGLHEVDVRVRLPDGSEVRQASTIRAGDRPPPVR